MPATDVPAPPAPPRSQHSHSPAQPAHSPQLGLGQQPGQHFAVQPPGYLVNAFPHMGMQPSSFLQDSGNNVIHQQIRLVEKIIKVESERIADIREELKDMRTASKGLKQDVDAMFLRQNKWVASTVNSKVNSYTKELRIANENMVGAKVEASAKELRRVVDDGGREMREIEGKLAQRIDSSTKKIDELETAMNEQLLQQRKDIERFKKEINDELKEINDKFTRIEKKFDHMMVITGTAKEKADLAKLAPVSESESEPVSEPASCKRKAQRETDSGAVPAPKKRVRCASPEAADDSEASVSRTTIRKFLTPEYFENNLVEMYDEQTFEAEDIAKDLIASFPDEFACMKGSESALARSIQKVFTEDQAKAHFATLDKNQSKIRHQRYYLKKSYCKIFFGEHFTHVRDDKNKRIDVVDFIEKMMKDQKCLCSFIMHKDKKSRKLSHTYYYRPVVHKHGNTITAMQVLGRLVKKFPKYACKKGFEAINLQKIECCLKNGHINEPFTPACGIEPIFVSCSKQQFGGEYALAKDEVYVFEKDDLIVYNRKTDRSSKKFGQIVRVIGGGRESDLVVSDMMGEEEQIKYSNDYEIDYMTDEERQMWNQCVNAHKKK